LSERDRGHLAQGLLIASGIWLMAPRTSSRTTRLWPTATRSPGRYW
jgi:hypothetical protein